MGVAAPARLIASDKAERMMEADLYVRPKPEAVARLVASHGSEVARNRWWYVNLAARRPQPEASPFEGVTDVVRFDIGRQPVPAPGLTQEESYAQLLEVLGRALAENRRLQTLVPKPVAVEASDA